MSKPKAEQVNWVSEAWAIKGVIRDINPPTLQKNALMRGGLGPLTEEQVAALEGLQDKLRRHLRYRLSRQKPLRPPMRGQRWEFTSRDPWETRRQLHHLTRIAGFEFNGGDLMAVEAMRLAGFILHFRCVDDRWKSELPLMVASISNPAGFNAAKARGVPRPNADRRSLLRRETETTYRNHPNESARQILIRLMGSRVVCDATSDTVTYSDSKGQPIKITMDSYENIFTDAKKAFEAGRPKRQTGR